MMMRAQMVENYILYPISRELVDYTMFLFHLIWESVLIFLGTFGWIYFYLRKGTRSWSRFILNYGISWRRMSVQMAENYISYPNSQELVDYTLFLFVWFIEKCPRMIRHFLFFIGKKAWHWTKRLISVCEMFRQKWFDSLKMILKVASRWIKCFTYIAKNVWKVI